MAKLRGLWIGVGALLLVACGEQECEDAGRTFQHGEQWTCSDGCNWCGCDDGLVSQTAAGCSMPPGPAAGKRSCFVDDHWCRHGQNWLGEDACDLTCDDGQLLSACE